MLTCCLRRKIEVDNKLDFARFKCGASIIKTLEELHLVLESCKVDANRFWRKHWDENLNLHTNYLLQKS